MALWYVDNAASGANNGTSWTDAWTSIATMEANYASINPGDTIYISGGATTKTYNEGFALPKSGTAGNVITISTGQDSGHNGTVIMNPPGNWILRGNIAYVHITGNVNGLQHMEVQNPTGGLWMHGGNTYTVTSMRWSYIDFGARDNVIAFSGSSVVTGFEFDHCNIEKTANGADYTFQDVGSFFDVNGYDTNLIHHNTITIHNDSILGPDLVKWGSGISFYNNHVLVIPDGCGTTCGQHTDFFQLQMSHYKIYNNIFEGSGDQGIFYSGFGAPNTMTGLLIYNNLWIHNTVPGGVYDAIGLDTFAKPTIDLVDVVVANNTFVDFTAGDYLIALNGANSYTNCHVKNNLFKNCSGANLGLNINAAVSVSNNTAVDSAVEFVSYTQYATSTNNLRPAPTDVVARDQGVDLSSLIPAVDFEGNARPQGAAWDIGAYEYTEGTAGAHVIGRVIRWL